MKKVKDWCYKVVKKTNGSEQMEKVKDWNYKVVEKIGQGAFGEVYKCLDLETGKKVAIKIITIQNEPEGVPSYLISRVSLLKELEHDNIVRLLDVLTSGRYVYLVFEYLDLDLGSFIRKHTITSIRPLIKTILTQILVGLAYCHSHNILHGDLQPSNVLIDLNSKKVKLADFGLASSLGVPHTEYSYNEVESPYKAPEYRIRSSIYSTPHDVWAVGCIFAEMASGKPLFPCGKKDHLSLIVSLFGKPTKETWPGVNYISELLHSHSQCKPADLAEQLLSLGLEPSGVELLCKMLCLDPHLRVTANDALLHRYLRHAEDLRIAETVSFKLPSSNNHALVKKCLKGESKVPSWYFKSADTVPSSHRAAVRMVQTQDFKVASCAVRNPFLSCYRSSPSGDQGVYSSQMHDKYEYKHVIATTHGAVVHKCRHYETDQIVAIKKINFEAPSEGVPSSVIREVAHLKKLEHKYIVRLLDVQSDLKSVNLVFEYIDVTLHNIIQWCHPIDSRWIKKFLYCILSGISYLHADKILHRDLTPTNLLVDIENKIVKIADFGMAKEVDAPFDTHTNEVVTLNYRAPELLLGRTNYSAAIDMWAAGCIFAEMVKGKCLFSGKVKYDVLHGIFSYFGKPDADTLPEVTSLCDQSWRKPIDKLNLAEELTRLEPDGLDLLFRMLSLNPTTRITAKSALNHPYFKGTRSSPLSPPKH